MQLMLYTKYGAEFMVGCYRLAVFHICIRSWGYPQRYHTQVPLYASSISEIVPPQLSTGMKRDRLGGLGNKTQVCKLHEHELQDGPA